MSSARNGSTAVEFSGHTTKSGAGCSPDSTRSASSTVASTWLRVTWRWSSRMSLPSPGTSPWTTATLRVPTGSTSYGASTGSSETIATAPIPPTAMTRARAPFGHRGRQQCPEQGQHERHAGHADVGQSVGPGRARHSEGQPAPGHARERPAGADRLHRDPRGREPHGPPAQAQQQHSSRAQRGVEGGLETGQGQPGVDTDGAHPVEQDELEADPEGQAGDPGATRRQTADGKHESGDPDRQQQMRGRPARTPGPSRRPRRQRETGPQRARGQRYRGREGGPTNPAGAEGSAGVLRANPSPTGCRDREVV